MCLCLWFTYLLTYFISTVHLKKLTVSQLVKKFPAFYGTRRFITAFTSARHLSLSWSFACGYYIKMLHYLPWSVIPFFSTNQCILNWCCWPTKFHLLTCWTTKLRQSSVQNIASTSSCATALPDRISHCWQTTDDGKLWLCRQYNADQIEIACRIFSINFLFVHSVSALDRFLFLKGGFITFLSAKDNFDRERINEVLSS